MAVNHHAGNPIPCVRDIAAESIEWNRSLQFHASRVDFHRHTPESALCNTDLRKSSFVIRPADLEFDSVIFHLIFMQLVDAHLAQLFGPNALNALASRLASRILPFQSVMKIGSMLSSNIRGNAGGRLQIVI